MFRDGVVLVEPAGAATILPHEEIDPARVDSLLRAWIASGVQETPITVLIDDQEPALARLIVADGHHRYEAARRIAASRARRVAVAARFFRLTAAPEIKPAHRVIRKAPQGWAMECRVRLQAVAGAGAVGFCARGRGGGRVGTLPSWNATIPAGWTR